jgi:peptidoglycan-N-acetylglucosamine deacetylase
MPIRSAALPLRAPFRIWLVALTLLPALAWAQSVALTFDDGFDPRTAPEAVAWNARILKALADAHLSSVLFVAGVRVDSPAGLALVRAWGEAGHHIANHTYHHIDFGSAQVTVGRFTEDIALDEALLQDFPGWTRRLRFPYLKEGDTAQKRDALRAWLTAHDYASGAVSIDASDWYYDARYASWRRMHPQADPAAFRQTYLDHLWGRAQYYDSLSRQVLGRSAHHVLLLHANRINAEFLPDVIMMFRARGWTLIAPEDAYQDPLYALKPSTLPAGESILWSLAREAGDRTLRYPAEDDVYEKPILDRLGL